LVMLPAANPVGHLTAQQSMANATIGDMQGQVNAADFQAERGYRCAAKQAAATEQAKAAAAHSPAAKAAAIKRTTTENKRLKELQARIDDQQKRLKDTQDEVARPRGPGREFEFHAR